MPRWICPYCITTAEVKPTAVGHLFPCTSCSRESIVIDADAEQLDKLRLEKALETANSQGLRSVMIANIALGVGFVIIFINAIFQLLYAPALGKVLGMLAIGLMLLVAALISPMLDAINEIHRCRRLLEELLRKKK